MDAKYLSVFVISEEVFMSEILDGKLVSQTIKENLKKQVLEFKEHTGVTPGLATVLVGEDAASQVYVRNKIKSTKACGMNSFHYDLPAETTQSDLLKLVNELNLNPEVHGILVQLPLPQQISEDAIIEAIIPEKDVDGFHPVSMGKLLVGKEGLRPCTPHGVMKILDHYNLDLSGKDVVIVGRSNIVGKPQAIMMLEKNATVTITHSRTKNLAEKIKQADVVVAAVGRAKFISGDWIKPGAVVVDVGINRLDTGKLCGDVDFEIAKENASYITPVPGGVGPMTIAMLLVNTLTAAKQMNKGI